MTSFNYENIDLFYYHSIDFDFARFFSILDNGILSRRAAKEENIKYFCRNKTEFSSGKEYVNVNHYPRTIMRFAKIENELFDSNKNKICFVIDDIGCLEKQASRKRSKYSNERQFFYKIDPSNIKGILLREEDANKKLSLISFDYKFADKEYFEEKVFTIIRFFNDTFGTFGDTNKLYFLIGKLREARISGMSEDIIKELITKEINYNVNLVVSSILGIDNPTLLDVISYFNTGRYPIYVMNRFDIELAGTQLSKKDPRIEEFKRTTKLSLSEIKEKRELERKSLKYLRKMSDNGLDIYFGNSVGPLTEDDFKITEEVKKLTLKK